MFDFLYVCRLLLFCVFCWLCSLVVRLLARVHDFLFCEFVCFCFFLFACVGALGCCLFSLLV